MTTHTIGTAVLDRLHRLGVRHMFGIPGDFALPYFRIIEASKILPLYTLSHEPGVGFAADYTMRAGTLKFSGQQQGEA